jgi:hypothetical protein
LVFKNIEIQSCAKNRPTHPVALIAGYPLFLLHHFLLKKSPAVVQNLFFAVTGTLVALWAIGGQRPVLKKLS